MPHTKSAKKRLRQSAKRREQNLAVKKEIKNQIKQFLKAVQGGNPEQMRQEYTLISQRLDKAGARRVIHPNKAARKKSRLAHLLNKKLTGGAPAAAPK
jgi:small subunit ribosomal protein S20